MQKLNQREKFELMGCDIWAKIYADQGNTFEALLSIYQGVELKKAYQNKNLFNSSLIDTSAIVRLITKADENGDHLEANEAIQALAMLEVWQINGALSGRLPSSIAGKNASKKGSKNIPIKEHVINIAMQLRKKNPTISVRKIADIAIDTANQDPALCDLTDISQRTIEKWIKNANLLQVRV